MTSTCDVLVVGAGPGGLATALSAARHGARVLVVEKHPGTSIHPRSLGVSTRTMEIFRTWGIADGVRAGSLDMDNVQTTLRTLADRDDEPYALGWPEPADALKVSPERPAGCPQDHIEPLLLDQVRRHGGEVRFETRLTALHLTSEGVRADLSGRDGMQRVDARFVVGADGARGTLRSLLGIDTTFHGSLGDWVQVLFRADLDAAIGGRRYFLYNITHPEATGLLLPAGRGRWAFARQVSDGVPASGADWVELLRVATDTPRLRPELFSTLSFTMAVEVAHTFRSGPGFLVGDAAHRMTPLAASGLNTAVHDGHNLGWKLAAVAGGWGADALLDSYDEERRPVGLRNALSSLGPLGPVEDERPGGLARDLGGTYRSAVIADDGDPAGPNRFAPSGSPGERAPHVRLGTGSTVDLFDGGFTLLTGRAGAPWRHAAARLPLAVPELGPATAAVAAAHGIGEHGATLVRPDGIVAWRATTAAARPDVALRRALTVATGQVPVAAVA